MSKKNKVKQRYFFHRGTLSIHDSIANIVIIDMKQVISELPSYYLKYDGVFFSSTDRLRRSAWLELFCNRYCLMLNEEDIEYINNLFLYLKDN